MKYSLSLATGVAEMVPQDLLYAWMQVEIGGPHADASEEFKVQLAAAHSNRQFVLLQKLDSAAAVVLMPVYWKSHWTLIVVRKSGDEVLVDYKDSLETLSNES